MYFFTCLVCKFQLPVSTNRRCFHEKYVQLTKKGSTSLKSQICKKSTKKKQSGIDHKLQDSVGIEVQQETEEKKEKEKILPLKDGKKSTRPIQFVAGKRGMFTWQRTFFTSNNFLLHNVQRCSHHNQFSL
jgi:hypothetical protein